MFKQKTLALLVSGALMTMAGTTQAIAAQGPSSSADAYLKAVAPGLLPS